MIRPLLRLIAVAAIGLSALTAFAQAPDMPAPVDLSGDTEAVVTIDLTTPPADLWQHIRNGFAMPDLEDRRVAQQQALAAQPTGNAEDRIAAQPALSAPYRRGARKARHADRAGPAAAIRQVKRPLRRSMMNRAAPTDSSTVKET